MKQALDFLNSNEYDQALQRMEDLVKQNRSIENLHNLAWMFVNEEEDLDAGLTLAEESVKLVPEHPFPYALLAEVYMRKNDLDKAEPLLYSVLEMDRIPNVLHNLGVLHVRKKEWKKAAQCFHEIARPSSYVQMLEVYCLIQAGDAMAKELLLQWDEKQDDFVGWMEAADLWIEMGEFIKAKECYEKEWDTTISSPYPVERFGYVLYQLGFEEQLIGIQEQTLRQIEEELEEVQSEEDWTEEERTELIQDLEEQLQQVRGLPEKLKSGFVPLIEIDFYIEGGCYLFGCKQHNHPFY
ncbi:tetratricopeptide repeat protein [Paucisalibacillus globulus]|uniref:tetratricopeptide repeat protein n=1 Tax=Paucisalibacillus globulus TaxID=351095 RepID=UPI0004190850|nr:tetratricopeptide repeat protein [Paucisalibacillus globulus]